MKSAEPGFTLKEPNGDKESLLYMKVYLNYKRITISTGVKVLPNAWDKKDGSPITDKKILTKLEKDYPGVLSKAKTIESTIVDYKRAYEKAVTKLNMIHEEYDENILKEQIQKELGKDPLTKARLTLSDFIDIFIKDIENDRRLTTRGKPFTNGTIKNYKGFQAQFKAYQKDEHKNIDFDDVNLEFRNKFVTYFTKKSYSPNTIWRHVKHLKSIMNVSFEEGLHSNIEFQKRRFMVPQVGTTEIYLTNEELDKISNLDLSELPHYDLARDVFLVGCYTAQRYSDYSRISQELIKTTTEGNKVISLTQLKTGTKVMIPIMPKLDMILKKYDYTLPKTHEQKVNLYIKKVVEKAGINNPENDDLFTKGKRSVTTKPKNELVKTHTARRSGCTNMYLAGIKPIDIMKISGHKTEREFLKYIRITNQETADSLATHPYFR